MRIGNFIYALRGNGAKEFRHYDTAQSTWSVLATAPASVSAGVALATDGTDLSAVPSNTWTTFWQYTVAPNTLVERAVAASIAKGGALAFVR